jgi:2-oxoisovalerate dehydrogenase E1 component
LQKETLLKAFRLMCLVRSMAETYERNRQICKYVHSTSRGHEAIQLAAAFQLTTNDFVSPYYRDESLLLGLNYSPYELMLQLLAKKDDPFTGGRAYYAHPSSSAKGKTRIIQQSSATGMQVIPTTGIAQGIQFLELTGSTLLQKNDDGSLPVVLCSLGDASITEGEVSEAFQFAVLKKLPIIYLVQDNGWGISVTSEEARAMDAYEYASGFPGMERIRVDGADFFSAFEAMQYAFQYVREKRTPILVQASVPLLGHHTSGVRKEFYRPKEDLEVHGTRDPIIILKNKLNDFGINGETVAQIEMDAEALVQQDFARAVASPDPDPLTVEDHVFAPTQITVERGSREPDGAEKIMMVDAALFALREIMEDYPEAIMFGQDIGRRLGGVFREAATLADQFGDHRVFNTAIQEAYIIGSTAGLSATGVKPIVEVQFGDYIYPGINQLVSEISKSCYLSAGKFPIQTLIRVPVGAYGGGGPYHSGSVESLLLAIKGIKLAYPSNAADMKGLMKAAFLDPNPVLMLEHKGLYWSKVPGTEQAKRPEPSRDYILPLGKANIILPASPGKTITGESICVVTYGMGVYWALTAATSFAGSVEIIDLRTLFPLDEDLVFSSVKKHGKCIVLTEEQQNNSFAEALAYRITKNCFQWLDSPVDVLGALNVPAVPMNMTLEQAMLPNASKLASRISALLKS